MDIEPRTGRIYPVGSLEKFTIYKCERFNSYLR